MPAPAPKEYIPIRIDLLRGAVAALRFKAHSDSGHSFGDSHFLPEDTWEWQAADLIEWEIEEELRRIANVEKIEKAL